MKLTTAQRDILRRVRRMEPIGRLDERDYIALLLPHAFPVTAQVEQLALALNATVILTNSWSDRYDRPHERAQNEGQDPSGPCLYVERFIPSADAEGQATSPPEAT